MGLVVFRIYRIYFLEFVFVIIEIDRGFLEFSFKGILFGRRKMFRFFFKVYILRFYFVLEMFFFWVIDIGNVYFFLRIYIFY